MDNVDKVSTLMLMRDAPKHHAHRVAGSKLWKVMSAAQQRGKFKSLQSHKEEMSQVALPEHNSGRLVVSDKRFVRAPPGVNQFATILL